MQYLLLLHVQEAGWGQLTPADQEAADEAAALDWAALCPASGHGVIEVRQVAG